MSKFNVSNISRIFLGSLLGLCCALFPVSVVASAAVDMSSAQIYSTQVRSNVSFGTGTVTANLPRAANDRFYLQAANDANYRGSVVRLNTRFNATPAGMVGGLRNALRVNPASLAGMAVVTGLLAGVDWLIDEGLVVRRLGGDYSSLLDYSGDYTYSRGFNWYYAYEGCENINCTGIGDTLLNYHRDVAWSKGSFLIKRFGTNNNYVIYYSCPTINNGAQLVGVSGTACFYLKGAPEFEPPDKTEPVSNEEIAALEFPQRFYDPDFWGLNFPLAGAVASYVPPVVPDTPVSPDPENPNLPDPLPPPAQPIPAFEPVPEPPVIEQPIPEIEPASPPAPEGAIQETTRETVCNWSGRELICNQQIKRQVFLDGVPLSPPEIENVQLPQSADGLTDCAFFPTLCEWLNWTKEPLEDDVDLDGLINEFEPDDDSYSLDLGVAVCPAPIAVNLGFLNKDLELSYEPACDLMTMIRPLILASAYLLAAYIYLGVLRG